MNARRNGIVGIIDRDALQIAQAEGIRLRVYRGHVVKVIAVVPEVFEERVAVIATKHLQKLGAGLRDIGASQRLLVAQAL